MKHIRRLAILFLVLAVALIAALWWNQPKQVDMSQYAPADALIFLESNRPVNVAISLSQSEAGKAFSPVFGIKQPNWFERWVARAVWLGIGPTKSVILARSQVAVVVLDLDATEKSAGLRIKPGGALIIETHTSETRIKPVVERSLQEFAKRTFGVAEPQRTREECEYLEWTLPATDRKLVAAVDGSVVVIGNTKRAVQICIQTRRGLRPSLRGDKELEHMRGALRADQALAFGYISSQNTARLFSWAVPILFGRSPGDSQLEQLLSSSASKLFRSIGWSSRAADGLFEDRYVISLEPSVLSNFKASFKPASANPPLALIPGRVYSATMYRFEDPALVWRELESAVGSRLDALSTIVFTAFLNTVLLPYGIERPREFLSAVGPEILTIRVREDSEASLLVVRVRDAARLKSIFRDRPILTVDGLKTLAAPAADRLTVVLFDQYAVLGRWGDVEWYIRARDEEKTVVELSHKCLTPRLAEGEGIPGVVTCTNDEQRILSFVSTLAGLNGVRSATTETTNPSVIESLPFAVTETRLGPEGIERTTRSAFGQFGALLALLEESAVGSRQP